MRIFKQKYRDRHGDLKEVGRFYAEFRADDKVRRVPLFGDKLASRDAARQIERLMASRGAGEAPDAALTRWLETMPSRLRERLVEVGALDSRRVAAFRPLTDHLDEYREALLARGTSERQADLIYLRVRKIIDGCKFMLWTDIAVGRVQSFIAGLGQPTKKKRGLSPQTLNFYITAIKQFCRWAERDGRITTSPVSHLEGFNIRLDRRHDRRALGLDEVRRLIATAQRGGVVFGASGCQRAMLYRVAIETGLRAGELRSLTKGSFHLDGNQPVVVVAAGYSKRRREDCQPLRPPLAAALNEYFAIVPPGAGAFGVPRREAVAKMLKTDLDAARAAWIKEAITDDERARRAASDFLAYKDAAGRFADFHSLRHSFITNLVNGGVHPKTAQVLARHSTITLTMDRYTHSLRGAEAAALAVLPDLSAAPEPLRATGT